MLIEAGKKLEPILIGLRRELHRHPELSGQEIRTEAFVLRSLPFQKIKRPFYPFNDDFEWRDLSR